MSTADLTPSESCFVAALKQLGFGRIESVRIHGGELILNPWPTMVQLLRFGASEIEPSDRSPEFELKKPIVELFAYVRGLDDGEIQCLEVRHGLPFAMQVEVRPDVNGRGCG
ncbi:MAG: hypothetical protein ABSH47_16610 [Bryobacteraceae bacterium]|jgi:hypothetical protein